MSSYAQSIFIYVNICLQDHNNYVQDHDKYVQDHDKYLQDHNNCVKDLVVVSAC